MNVRSKLISGLNAIASVARGCAAKSQATGRLHLLRHAALAFVALGAIGHVSLIAAEPAPLPAIVELTAFPAKLELNGIRDSRRVLVSGKTAEGQIVDLTLEAKLA